MSLKIIVLFIPKSNMWYYKLVPVFLRTYQTEGFLLHAYQFISWLDAEPTLKLLNVLLDVRLGLEQD